MLRLEGGGALFGTTCVARFTTRWCRYTLLTVEVVPERSSYVIEVEEVHYLVFVEVVEVHFSSSSSSSTSCCYDERLLDRHRSGERRWILGERWWFLVTVGGK